MRRLLHLLRLIAYFIFVVLAANNIPNACVRAFAVICMWYFYFDVTEGEEE